MTARRLVTIASILFVGSSVISLGPPIHGQSSVSDIELISTTPAGAPSGAEPSRSSQRISADNRYVVFASASNQLVPGDTNGVVDIFVRDRQSGTTALVSRASDGSLANGASLRPVISANGRYVAFTSAASNLVPGDANNQPDVFVRDLVTSTTSIVSVSTGGAAANFGADGPAISADGRYVAFESASSTLIVPGDTNLFNYDVFLRDTVAGTTGRVSLRTDGSEIIGASSTMPSISADGQRIAFQVTDDTRGGPTPGVPPNLHHGIYVRDLNANQTILVSARPDGTPAERLFETDPVISANGRYVSFTSWEDLDPNFPDENQEVDGPYSDVFVRDLQTSVTDRVSLPFSGGPVEESGGSGTISGTGRYVVYFNNGLVRVRDRIAGVTIAINAPGGAAPDGYSSSPAISEDGQLVYFESDATNLAPGDANGLNDAFVARMAPSADLSLTLSSSTAQPPPDSNVTLTIAVTNSGPNDTTGVAVRAPLPTGLAYVSSTGAGYSTGTGIWSTGVLTNGSTATLQIVAAFTATSAVTMTAQVSASSLPDPDSTPDNDNPSEDDQKSVVLWPDVADLSLDLQANTTQPPVNSNVTLTAQLTNSGPGNATGVSVRVPLPSGLTFVFSNPPGAYDAATGVWTRGPIANGTTATLSIVARVTATTTIDVAAEVSASDQLDPDSTPNNNVASEDDQRAIQLTPVVTGIVVNDATMVINPSDGKCTLVEAIIAANTDLPSGNAVGECAGGNGPDTIHLRALNAPKDITGIRDQYRVPGIYSTVLGPTALPVITSDITIEGGGGDITRSGAAAYRLFAVDVAGRLTLNNVAVTSGFVNGTTSLEIAGGGILNRGTLTLNNAYLAANQARCDGGGVQSTGPLIVRASAFQFNVSGCSGGAIRTFNAGSVALEATTLQFNEAPNGGGGGIMIHGTTTASIVDSLIDQNSAKTEAGGVFAHNNDANVSIVNTRITNNVVTAGHGGGISNGRFDNIGAPFVNGGTMAISNSTISNNKATGGFGGGIANGGLLTIAGSPIADNQATRAGGGVHNAGALTVVASIVTRNAGNGISSTGFGPLTVTNSTIGSNTYAGPGGGVFLFFSPSATFIGTNIVGNSALDGGGIYSLAADAAQTLTLDSTLVQNNLAAAAGAGLYIQGGTTTIGNNTRVAGNIATTAGGGILLNHGGTCCSATVTMTGGVIENNSANGSTSVGGGGGIAHLDINPASTMTLNGVVIRGNGATNGDGGGIFNRGTLAMNGGELRGNTATSGGGLGNGITSTLSGGAATLTNVTVDGNVATQYGGGLFNASTVTGTPTNTVIVSGGSVQNNRAQHGGGIFIRPASAVNVAGAHVGGNAATVIGGGIVNDGGSLLIYRATLSGNTADFAGALYVNGPTAVFASTISGNTADRIGGIRVQPGATANVANTTISSNTATSTTANGGGFDVSGTLSLASSTIANNIGRSGGINSDGTVTIDNTILAGNRRPDGVFSECASLVGATWTQQFNIIGQDPGCLLSTTVAADPFNTSDTIDPSAVFVSLIAPLANNGGPTFTHALLPGSLAIDGGNFACPGDDQRGQLRPVDGDGDGGTRCDIGAFEQQTPLQGPAAALASLAPSSALAGGAGVTLIVNGAGFAAGSVARWNGAPRTTYVASPTRLAVIIPASDLATASDLSTTAVTVVNPGAGASNALPFTIVSPKVLTFQSQIAAPGTSATASRLPAAAGQAGVSATLTNNDPASSAAVVTVATYGASPVSGTIFAAGGLFDVQVIGADPSDSIDVRYYYPSTVTGATEASLQLLYWTGTAWAPVIGSGGALPVKLTTDNLDGTISGGRVTVTLDATSTPAITNLGGTVFALAPAAADVDPPATTATVSPPPNANGWNKTAVTVTLNATDAVSAVSSIEFNLDGSGWKLYAGPIKIGGEGIHALRFRARDSAGNVEPERSTTVKIDKTAPLALAIAHPFILWPPNGQLVDIKVNISIVDFLSGSDGFKLVSVVSNDPRLTPDDIAGWTAATPDTTGRLRAEPAGRGRERLYFLTYEAVDRAGNTVRATATVLVPDWWW